MPRGQQNASALWFLDFSSKPRTPLSTTLTPITWGTISLSQKVSIIISVSSHLISQRISSQPRFLLAPREQLASQNIRPTRPRPLPAPSSNRAGSEDPWKGLSPGKWQQLAALLTLPNHHGWKSELERPQESPRSKDPLIWMRRQSPKGWSLLFLVTHVSRCKAENTIQISRCQGSAYIDTLTCKVHISKNHYLSFSESRPHRGPGGL